MAIQAHNSYHPKFEGRTVVATIMAMQGKLAKSLTSMTVDEVIAAGPGWTKSYRSSAAGRYQFMNATLKDLKRELGLRGTQVFDANLQDRLAYHLLKRRGYDAFMAGTIGGVEFGKRLAQEWASLPVLAATKGGSCSVVRGQSYYAGDGLNKSLVKPEAVEAVIAKARLAGPDLVITLPQSLPPEPAPPVSTGKAKGFPLWIIPAAIIVAVAVYFIFFHRG